MHRVLPVDPEHRRLLGLLDDGPRGLFGLLERDVEGQIGLTSLQHGGPDRLLGPADVA